MTALGIEARPMKGRLGALSIDAQSGGVTMERLTTIASVLLLSASSALAAGCMAEAAEETAEQDTIQAEQDGAVSGASQDEATTADEEAVGESAEAHSVWLAPSTYYKPEIITNWVPYVKWVTVPHVSHQIFSTLHYYPHSYVVYRPYIHPATWFVYLDD
jgi:hypothetical protein